MHLPNVIASLVAAQNTFDSQAYAACFTETAIVHDEGKTHTGRAEIQQWIAHANQAYQSTMQPKSYEVTATEALLTAEVSGTFPGSPAILHFHLSLKEDLIASLRITG